ncbi:hypothetical protein AGMMS49592_0570 [Endomicrobiia bacterium]|nr:hypothetical protein AGMMS49592_0570 [Endomicrobiia bacterium]
MDKKELEIKKQNFELEELKDILVNGINDRRLEKLETMIEVVAKAISNIEEYVTERMIENDFKNVEHVEYIANSIIRKGFDLTKAIKEKSGYVEKDYDGDTTDSYLRRKYEKEMNESLRLEDCEEDEEDDEDF